MNIKQGQTVKLLPEFLDSNEADTVYIAAEDYSGGGRILISDKYCTMNIIPTEMISVSMIESVE